VVTPDTLRGRVLVVEDERYVRDSLGELLASRGFDAHLEASAETALAWLARAPVDVVLTDLRLGGADGLDLVRRVRAIDAELPVVVLTGHGTIASAIACVRAGATDYLLKPADPDVLEVCLERALSTRALRREVELLRDPDDGVEKGSPVGASAQWRRVVQQVHAAAATDATVLLTGESGTGKEVLARLLHRRSPRAARAFVRVNCAAVPLEMWESEFFGHRRGAFTGALAARDGRFLLAHRGVLFMDEVGTMPLVAQAKILRAIESGEFDRLGDERPTRVDVRVVAATNSDLEADVAAGRFRQDLYFRLNVLRIAVPPLRERVDDIPALAAYFTRQVAARLGRPTPEIGATVMADLQAYPWPGNARELRNVIERALILSPDDTLSSLDLPPVEGAGHTPRAAGDGSDLNLRTRLAATEREIVIEALRRSGGVRKEAARLLGIDPRNLPYYLRKHGIDGSTDA
jgi:DNA-binding NtrC family response regulator